MPVGARMADADQAASLLREGIGLALEEADEGELLRMTLERELAADADTD